MRLACLFLFLPIIGFAQPKASAQESPAAIKPLAIGDTVPDVVLENIINYPATTARLSDFKGKLLILDFFASWCTVCIKKMPEIDALQMRYSNKMQVLVVTADDKHQIQSLQKKSKLLTDVFLPVVTSDSTTRKYFPHIFIPHYVWIGAQGRVVAITGPDEITDENIRKAIVGHRLSLPVKEDAMDFDHKKPLLQDGNGGSIENLLVKSFITNYLPGVPAARGVTQEGGRKRYYFTNHTLLTLFQVAFGFTPNQVRIETADTTAFYEDKGNRTAWLQNHSFSYEITAPAEWAEQKVKNWMIADICRYFSLSAGWESVRSPCFVLLDANNPPAPSQGGKSWVKVIQGTDSLAFINQAIDKLVLGYNRNGSVGMNKPFIINEATYKGKIDCMLTTQELESFEGFEALIRKIGFRLAPAIRMLDLFIIKDLN